MIVQYPNSTLKEKCVSIEPSQAQHVVQLLKKELTSAASKKRGGLGLSAPQVGHAVQVFVMYGENDNLIEFINPQIISVDPVRESQVESCLSLPPGVNIPIKRPCACKIRAMQLDGSFFDETLVYLDARVALHEIDHLNGITILDHATPKQRATAMKIITAAIRVRNRLTR